MRVKNKRLEWYVLNYDFNAKCVIKYNIFYQDYIDRLYKAYKKKEITNKEQLKDFTLRYCFQYRGRVEYEIMVGDVPFTDRDKLEKIDAYFQIEMNIDRIVDYVNDELCMNL